MVWLGQLAAWWPSCPQIQHELSLPPFLPPLPFFPPFPAPFPCFACFPRLGWERSLSFPSRRPDIWTLWWMLWSQSDPGKGHELGDRRALSAQRLLALFPPPESRAKAAEPGGGDDPIPRLCVQPLAIHGQLGIDVLGHDVLLDALPAVGAHLFVAAEDCTPLLWKSRDQQTNS